MMGVVSYIQERIISYEKETHKLPGFVILGSLEWHEILQSKDDEEFTVAGIPCIPDLTKPQGVFLT
jgi:hypothetical protein